MARPGRRHDSSVIFIGEDEAPLLGHPGWTSEDDEDPNKKQPRTTRTQPQSRYSQNAPSHPPHKNNNYKSSANANASRSKSLRSTTLSSVSCVPRTFGKYLFSENSVLTRLVTSLCPPVGKYKRVPVDAEGSFLSCFLLASTLYWGYVSSKGESRVSALFLATTLTVGYLVTVSAVTWLLSFCTKTIITLSQIFAILSYSLFGHALTLIICSAGYDRWFIPIMTVIGGLGSLRICLILLARTPIPACRFVLCTPVAIAHLLYLVYLHFSIMKSV